MKHGMDPLLLGAGKPFVDVLVGLRPAALGRCATAQHRDPA